MTCFAQAQTPGGAGAGRGGRPSDVGAGGAKHPETLGPGSPVSGALPFLEAPLRLKHPPHPGCSRRLPGAPNPPRLPLSVLCPCSFVSSVAGGFRPWRRGRHPNGQTDVAFVTSGASCSPKGDAAGSGRGRGRGEGGLTADGQARRWAPAGRGETSGHGAALGARA